MLNNNITGAYGLTAMATINTPCHTCSDTVVETTIALNQKQYSGFQEGICSNCQSFYSYNIDIKISNYQIVELGEGV